MQEEVASIDRVRKRLRSVTSLSYHEKRSLRKCRKEVTGALRDVVSLVQSSCSRTKSTTHSAIGSTDVTRYNASLVEDLLSPNWNKHVETLSSSCSSQHEEWIKGGIGWAKLCSHHDAQQRMIIQSKSLNVSTDNAATLIPPRPTPFMEILQILLNPTVIPSVCALSVTLALVRVLVRLENPSQVPNNRNHNSPRMEEWTSFELLQNAIDNILARRPGILFVGPLMTYLASQLAFPPTNESQNDKDQDRWIQVMQTYDVEHASRVLSLLNRFSRSFQHLGFGVGSVPCILNLIRDIDGLDVSLLQVQDRDKTKESTTYENPTPCAHCRSNSQTQMASFVTESNKRKRRPKTLSLSALHDAEEESAQVDDGSGILIKTINVMGGGEVDQVSRCPTTHRFQTVPSKPSLKDIIHAPASTVSYCSCQKKVVVLSIEEQIMSKFISFQKREAATDFTKLSLKMVLLRSNLYHTALSIYDSLVMTCHKERSQLVSTLPLAIANEDQSKRHAIPPSHQTPPPVLTLVVNMTCRCPLSSSTRLCAVLLADVRSKDGGYLFLMQRIWHSFTTRSNSRLVQNSSRQDEYLLRMYSELVVECSHFDNPIFCWQVLKPLLDHVLALHKDLQQYEHNDLKEILGKGLEGNSWCSGDAKSDIMTLDGAKEPSCKSILTERIRLILRAMSYILIHRRRTLSGEHSSSCENESGLFHQFIAQLSVSFGRRSMWISSKMPPLERIHITHTLQAAGILSFFDGNQDEEDEVELELDSNAQNTNHGAEMMEWPFPTRLGLREACKRMGPRVGRNKNILVMPKRPDDILHGDLSLKSEKRKVHHKPGVVIQSAEPIMDYLNDDLIRTVFSFLGYKRLARALCVCKSWSSLGSENVFWEKHYTNRFRVKFEDDHSRQVGGYCGSLGKAWKESFAKHWIAERSVRSKVSGSGFQHLICDHVGCPFVVRGKEQLRKHIRKHQAAAEKRGLKLAKAEERREQIEKRKQERQLQADARKEAKEKSAKQAKTKELHHKRRKLSTKEAENEALGADSDQNHKTIE
eukprot:scaffold76006_cov47-Attheya_sp.AAC.1